VIGEGSEGVTPDKSEVVGEAETGEAAEDGAGRERAICQCPGVRVREEMEGGLGEESGGRGEG